MTNLSTKLFNLSLFGYSSKLEYASIIWDPNRADLVKKIEKVQNRFLRYLCLKVDHVSPMYISNKYLRNRFNITELEKRRKVACVSYLYKSLNYLENNPLFLENLYFSTSRNIRRKKLFYMPKVRTEAEKGMAIYKICLIANEYPLLPFFSCWSSKNFVRRAQNIIC